MKQYTLSAVYQSIQFENGFSLCSKGQKQKIKIDRHRSDDGFIQTENK